MKSVRPPLTKVSAKAPTGITGFDEISGDALNSAQALSNLAALCRAHLPDQHEIEFVDAFKDPQRALADGIFMTPILIKLAPSPVRRIIGTLSQTQAVLLALGLGSHVA